MRLCTGRSSWVSTSVSPGGCEICLCCPQCKFTALMCCCEDSVCKHSGIPVQGFALVCSDFFFFFLACHTKFKQTWAGTTIYVLFFIIDKSASYFPDSCQAYLQSTSVHYLSLYRLYAVALVFVPASGRVQGATLQQLVDYVSACLLVLVSEKGVHERVAGCLAVS